MAHYLSAPVSKVPWVVREPSNQALKDSRFCKEVLSSNDKQKTETNLRLYSLINEAFFPLYLPSRYHSMDCVALKNMTKVEGHYWTHASHFLLTSQLHGVFLWQLSAKFASDLTLSQHLNSLPLLCTKKKSEMFKDGLELCKNSADFLLNPWVLLQLPWHPVLLLQWTAGILTELNLLRLEMVEFYRWPMISPRHSKVVKKLFDVVSSLHSQVLQPCMSSVLMDMHFERATEHNIYSCAGKFLSHLTTRIMPILEFVASGKARDIARALKRMVFGKDFLIKFKKDSTAVSFLGVGSRNWEGTYNCMFSDHFWKQGKYWEIIGTHLDGGLTKEMIELKCFTRHFLHGSEDFVDEATPQWIAEMEAKYGKRIDSEKIFGLLEHLISKGVITNVCKKDVLTTITSNMTYFTQCYYRLMELKANIDGGLRDEDAGVVYDVLYTRTKLRIADVECAMIFKIFDYCFSQIRGQHQLKAINTEGPEMELRQISSILTNIIEMVKRNIMSGRRDLERSVPASCRRKVDVKEDCPNLAEGAEIVATKFEDRIKRIVFNMFEDHKFWSKNQFKLHPDWQFVQYILPCFVASFLEFSDDDKVQQKDKESYIKIVHELIKGFEVNPTMVASMKGPYPGGYSPYELQGLAFHDLLMWQMHLLHTGLDKALGSSPKSRLVSEIFKRNFLSVLLDCMDSVVVDKLRNDEYSHYMCMLWRIQVYRLFGKILKAIATAVPDCFQNLRALEMTMMANICSADHSFRFLNPIVSISYGLKGLDLDPVFEMLRYGALLKAKRLLGLETIRLVGTYSVTNPQKLQVLEECKKLGLEQIIALVMFYCAQSVTGQGVCEFKDKIRVPLDRVEEVFFAYRTGDHVKLKLLLGKMFTRYGFNFAEVSHEFASKVAPCAYQRALTKVKNGRVQMQQPCELTLLPIKHCRWCGLVRNDALRLCEECRSDRKFPFRTWFCGDECERQALDLVHREEHARHLIIAIGIESVRKELDQPQVKNAPKTVVNKKKKKSGRAKK